MININSSLSLTEQLAEQKAQVVQNLPAEIADIFLQKATELENSGIATNSLGVGDKAANFQLPDPVGNIINLQELLAKGPVLLTFYRGGWCPYCNLELRALQRSLPELEQYNASLVAISPETPDNSLSTAEKNQLEFAVLSDAGLNVARQYGLVFTLDSELRRIYEQFGIDLPKQNGDESYQLPIPATYVIDPESIIRYAYVNTDYTQRADPKEIIPIIAQL
ncbi:peroxiredoxin-like family protein [Calothrix rhizosoleniae]|uniref:peroxiredoxin-like family protein n=1 Tax=Calothrix rhizosoleniae TaxID=888997 RepID=UPI000B49C412|nr:peroxiredoxin-like family protein [Calothrix rhizosoleniae]